MPSDLEKLSAYNDTLAERQTAKDDVQDYARALWYQIQWENLLVPAPSAISIFGRLTMVAIAAKFNLVTPTNTGKFKYIKDTDFRATIVQLVNAGVLAFSKSYTNMDALGKHCVNLRISVGDVMALVMEQDMEGLSPKERAETIIRNLGPMVKRIEESTTKCSEAVTESAERFMNLLLLSQEIYEATTATHGAAEKRQKEIELAAQVINAKIKGASEARAQQKKFTDDMKKYADNAEKRFNDSVDKMPSPMGLIGMQMAQKLTDLAVMGGHMMIQKQLTMGQMAAGTANDIVSSAAKNKISEKPGEKPSGEQPAAPSKPALTVEDLDDPVFENADRLRDALIALKHVLMSGQGGGVNWDDVAAAAGKKTSLAYATSELDELSSAAYGKFKLAKEAKDISTAALEVAKELKKLNDDRNNSRVDEIVTEVKTLAARSDKLATSVSTKAGQPPMQQPCQITPPQLPPVGKGDDSIINLAVSNAQFQVTATQAQATASREAYEKANQSMLDLTKQLNEFMGELNKLDIEKIDWAKIQAILFQTVQYLAELCNILQRLSEFFETIKNSVVITLATAFKTFTETVRGERPNPQLGGMHFSTWAQKVLLKQAIFAAKVEYVMFRIANAYTKMYQQHIADGMTMLSKMPPVASESGNTRAALEADAAKLQDWCEEAQRGMRSILQAELDSFNEEMEARSQAFEAAFGKILPPPAPETRKAIEEAKTEAVAEAAATITAVKPSYKAAMSLF
ncbi:hypothetical protein PUNSTDRAFT_140854 [Punctularia strigosozonata HHB-11173 SS5]|uniref:uncharacterized protein n=1 Tax=Punctularia strigosozonata (strain HHB-11173) TaxID=741275 RepID=UPI00044163ED|nr:uncharacterized protein PUNSTDRAFT_140854 [Punctularia strigosozonata HHB-11173 SS5]EIN14611.1 hypothetical protein PUNSTDRAFT_140854 [Punctularia strigosozonata HHB-11173 SS5]